MVDLIPADETVGPRIVQSVARAAQLLKAMAAKDRPMGLAELARAVSVSRPAVFHLVRTLQIEGFVAKNPDGTYQLDWGLYELGSAVVRTTNLNSIARFHMDRLAEAVGEAVLLSILSEDSVLYLDRGQSAENFSMVANAGRRSLLHTNASGKVLLANQSQAFIDKVLSSPLQRKTTATITHPDVLRAQLVEIRKQGFATCWQEEELGLSSLACPIFDYSGTVCAALTIAGPAQRVTPVEAGRLLGMLNIEAIAISEALGAPGGGQRRIEKKE